MKTLMLSFGIGSSTDRAGQRDDGSDRRDAAIKAAFELGPAWHGGQTTIFVKTDKPFDEAYQHVLQVLDDRDLLLVIELPNSADVRFSGLRFDEEGFGEIFPTPTEVPHLNEWAG
jgi:hypothetical protein